MEPAQTNRRALKRAWVIRWKNVSSCSPRPSEESMTPSWLSVERAMIFLRSDSTMAERPAISIVRAAIRRRQGRKS